MAASKAYSNGEISVIWEPSKCIHSGNCVKGLPKVFDVNKKPWINVTMATTDELIKQVDQCPSGALSHKYEKQANMESNKNVNLNLKKDGPVLFSGTIDIFDEEGNLIETMEKGALCRCGASSNKPFCDGSHKKIEFKSS